MPPATAPSAFAVVVVGGGGPTKLFPFISFWKNATTTTTPRPRPGKRNGESEGANKREVTSQDCGDEANDGFNS